MRHLVRAQDHELRLDRWLRLQFPSLPQSFLQSQLRKRKIRLQSPATAASSLQSAASAVTSIGDSDQPPLRSARANSILLEGSVVVIDAHLFHSKLLPQQEETAFRPSKESKSTRLAVTDGAKARVQELLDRVVYEDSHFLVLNKPHGLAVQEGSALTDSLARYLPSIAAALADSEQQHAQEPEPLKLVHRLDKETSGLLVLARSRLAAAKFSSLLRRGAVQKTYQALVSPSSTGNGGYSALKAEFEGQELRLPVDGKPAITFVERVARSTNRDEPNGTWLQLKPSTGRKHQLRLHCAVELKAPIVGDTKYGGPAADRLYLHATRIQFPDPFASTESPRLIDIDCPMWDEEARDAGRRESQAVTMNQLEESSERPRGRFRLATVAEPSKEKRSIHPEQPSVSTLKRSESSEAADNNRRVAALSQTLLPPPPPSLGVRPVESRRTLLLAAPLAFPDGVTMVDSDHIQDDDEQSQQEQDSEGEDANNQDAALDGSPKSRSRRDERRESISCEPMVHYGGFESVGKPQSMANGSSSVFRNDPGDADDMNFRSPIAYKPSSSMAGSHNLRCRSPLSSLAPEKSDAGELGEPNWTIGQFQRYLDVLDFLQDACGSSEDQELCVSADRLGQMERLLTSLLPPGV
ncbi:hypothetical protein BBJ28_00011490 [Nothophytophthora sp. Chile5]|nr:hypothetical protein BBJ28_00011490 [Nothophytophthora sp. Chile5]